MKNFQHYYDLIIDKLNNWLESVVTTFPNFVAALVVVGIFMVIASSVSYIGQKFLKKITHSQVVINLGRTLIKILVLVLGFIIALDLLGLQKAVFSILAGAGVLGLALGFAFQDLAANFLAGLIMAFRHPFTVGHVIRTNDYMGEIIEMNLRNTFVETFDGQVVIIPNKEVFEKPLINYSRNGKRRIGIDVGVAYDTDLDHTTDIATKAIENLDFIDTEAGVQATVKAFGDSSINLCIYYWIKYPGDIGYLDAITFGVKAIKKAFDDASINIPFPIRTLDLSNSEASPLMAKISKTTAHGSSIKQE